MCGVAACQATTAAPTPMAGASPAAPVGWLRGPFDVEARRALIGIPLPAPRAPPADAAIPVRNVAGVSFYVDDSKSVADPALKAANVAALAPLRRFVEATTSLG